MEERYYLQFKQFIIVADNFYFLSSFMSFASSRFLVFLPKFEEEKNKSQTIADTLLYNLSVKQFESQMRPNIL